MIAWFVIASGADYGTFVWSSDETDAKRIAIDYFDGFSYAADELTAIRRETLDDPSVMEPSVIPKETCFAAGFRWLCELCDRSTGRDIGGEIVDGSVFCDECAADMKTWPARRDRVPS